MQSAECRMYSSTRDVVCSSLSMRRCHAMAPRLLVSGWVVGWVVGGYSWSVVLYAFGVVHLQCVQYSMYNSNGGLLEYHHYY